MVKYKKEMSIEEIVEAINSTNVIAEVNQGRSFLDYKFHQELIEEQSKQHKEVIQQQNTYNSKQLFWSRLLVVATWALVIVTLLLVLFKK